MYIYLRETQAPPHLQMKQNFKGYEIKDNVVLYIKHFKSSKISSHTTIV